MVNYNLRDDFESSGGIENGKKAHSIAVDIL
jgi:hypothetical protein